MPDGEMDQLAVAQEGTPNCRLVRSCAAKRCDREVLCNACKLGRMFKRSECAACNSQPIASLAGSMILCAAVVGQQNNPLYIQLFTPTDDAVKFHYMVHASLDAVEEKVLLRRNPGEVPELYLGLLYPTEEYRVYGYITNTHIKFVLVLDESSPKDDMLQRVFKRLHNLFVDATSNPLYSHGLPIVSKTFAEGVTAVVSSYTPSS